MKTCTKCHKEFPLDSFGALAGTKDGHMYWCRTCETKRRRARPPAPSIEEQPGPEPVEAAPRAYHPSGWPLLDTPRLRDYLRDHHAPASLNQ